MDYPCAKFGNFSFSRFGYIVRTDRQNQRYTHVTTVGVSNQTIKRRQVATKPKVVWLLLFVTYVL